MSDIGTSAKHDKILSQTFDQSLPQVLQGPKILCNFDLVTSASFSFVTMHASDRRTEL